MELYQAPEMYSRVIHNDPDKYTQVRLTVSEFRGVEYLQIRKYYLDFEGEWRATPDGISMPIDFENSKELFAGLAEIISLAESKEIIEEYFKDTIELAYNR